MKNLMKMMIDLLVPKLSNVKEAIQSFGARGFAARSRELMVVEILLFLRQVQ